jgi:hypothetical protein
LLEDLEEEEIFYYTQSFPLLQEVLKMVAFTPFASAKDALAAIETLNSGLLLLSNCY